MPLSHHPSPIRSLALVAWCGVWIAALVFLLSPPEDIPAESAIFRADELVHAAGFAAITASAAVFCPGYGALAVVAALVAAASGLLEWFQGAVPGRSVSPSDFAANLYGSAAGFVLGALWIFVRRRVFGRSPPRRRGARGRTARRRAA